jgi:signal transduction histidine kinase
VLIEIVMLTILVWSNLNAIQFAHAERLSATSNSILKQFSRTAAVYMAEVDYAELEEYARRIIEHNEIAYLQVFTANNKEVIRLGNDIPEHLVLTDKHPARVDDNIFDVEADILLAGRQQGKVHIGFTLAVMNEAIRHSRNRSILIAATEIILSVLVTIFIGLRLTRKLTWLFRAAVQVSEGQLDVELPVKGHDEIAQTAIQFNLMVNELHKYRSQMEELVEVRTFELAVANKELEVFCSAVSHDLRSPLRAISSFSEIVVEDYVDKLDENGIDYLNRIRNSATKMEVLIDDMLQLSRVSRTELEIEEVDISLIATDILQRLTYLEPNRKTELIIEDGITCYGDRGLLIIVMENLIDNAWKYSSKRDVTKIQLGQKQQDGGCTFFIKDNGAGFNMKHVDKLFEEFKRLHGEAEFPGTGVGLATVGRVISRHKGKVWAEAEENKGATFFITLPHADT